MTYPKPVVADVDPNGAPAVSPAEQGPQSLPPLALTLQIPDTQKQQLYQALMTVVTVVLSIALTLVAQAVGQAMGVDGGAPPLSGEAQVGGAQQAAPYPMEALTDADPRDPLQTLGGTTHFTEIAVEEDLAVGGTLTVAGMTYTVTGPVTITGVLTDVLLLSAQEP